MLCERIGQRTHGDSLIRPPYLSRIRTRPAVAGHLNKNGFRRVVSAQGADQAVPMRWMTRFRRLARDYERLATTLIGYHFLAFASLMIARLASVMIKS